jgi:hypothetical protein
MAASDDACQRLVLAPVAEHGVQAGRPAGGLVWLGQDAERQPKGAGLAALAMLDVKLGLRHTGRIAGLVPAALAERGLRAGGAAPRGRERARRRRLALQPARGLESASTPNYVFDAPFQPFSVRSKTIPSGSWYLTS